MKNPFIKKMPFITDLRIVLRVCGVWVQKRSRPLYLGGIFMAVPALAVWLFVVTAVQTPSYDALVADIYEAQAVEQAKASESIYYVKRLIFEGGDKVAYVQETHGNAPLANVRVDEVETWQHNETALALIRSNGTEHSLEAFLKRTHDSTFALHHFGSADSEVPVERASYDRAHDLASLYTSYTSLERPAVPVLSEGATLVKVDEVSRKAYFTEEVSPTIIVESIVDLDSQLMVEEIIYVRSESNEMYEMTRITYEKRNVIPAESFEEIFDPTTYPYQAIATL